MTDRLTWDQWAILRPDGTIHTLCKGRKAVDAYLDTTDAEGKVFVGYSAIPVRITQILVEDKIDG